MKKVPYAVASYDKLAAEDYYFVDKTAYIRELEVYQVPVFLRPRRFGKSLWCSLIECYYDINRKDQFATLFGHTDIGANPTEERNRYLVMRFDFSVLKVSADIQNLERSFDWLCQNVFKKFITQYNSYFGDIDIDYAKSAAEILNDIMGLVNRYKTPPVYIVIDEYDNFTNQLITAHQDALYYDLTSGDSFLRTFFKVIKTGVGELSISRVFITGVLPVTIDDLTSGFNIGQVITLEKNTLAMMGFTQEEVDTYVDEIFADQGWDDPVKRQYVADELKSHYNGYRILPQSESLYNSTICNFYLNDMVINKGEIPTERIDHNLRTDIRWLRRLTGSEDGARELVNQLMFDGNLPVDLNMLQSKFNMGQFFEKQFFPLSLFYLGMLTFEDEFSLGFPNLTVKTIFTEYYNEIERITVSLGYTDMFRKYLKDKNLNDLFAGYWEKYSYWEKYIGQIPAQAFDKVNENFFRTTFYELSNRYLGRHYAFSIEVNYPSGRCDFEAIGRDETAFKNHAIMGEFKHYPKAEGIRLDIANLAEPYPEDVAQVTRYANDLQAKYPALSIRRFVVYTIGAVGYRFFSLD